MRHLLLAATLLLAACGGGSSSPQPASPPPPPPPARAIDFTFFGQSDPAITAPFTSAYFAIDWGDWTKQGPDIANRIIAEMQAAKARGVTKFILATGFLTLTADCRYVGTLALAQFKQQLEALGLAENVWMLYPMDEPDLHGCDDATIAQAYRESQATWGATKWDKLVRIGVIYGDSGHGTPGSNAATDLGRDKYGSGPQIVSIRADQHLILVPGGANGDHMRENPQPYVAACQANAQCSLVVGFLYVDYTDPKGRPQQGIANNGMLAAYRAAGCTLTRKC